MTFNSLSGIDFTLKDNLVSFALDHAQLLIFWKIL